MFTRTIIDIFHSDTVDLPLLANNGVQAVMMKATQGVNYVDPTFVSRMAAARASGLLVGSYHFGTGEDPVVQAHHWLDIAKPQDGDAMEFDWEANPSGASMTYDQACAFVREVFAKTGRFPLLYGSNYLNEKIPSSGDSILFSCPLSLASYTSAPKIPRGWKNYTLWQFTGDNSGTVNPHIFPGASAALDVYQFDGTIKELRAQWPFVVTQAPVPVPIPPPVPPVPAPKMMTHFALIAESKKLTFFEFQRIAEANTEQSKDIEKHWGGKRRYDMTAYAKESDVPLGDFKVHNKDDIGDPSALGYHTDENNQPVVFVKVQDLDSTCITNSHEAGETDIDAFGNRFIKVNIAPYGEVLILVEIGDPVEAFSYKTSNGLPVSDFITPEFYDEHKTPGVKYSFGDNLPGPLTVAKGGYFSFKLANGQWMQRVFWGDSPEDQGPFDWQLKPGEMVRTMVDRETRARRAP